MSGSVVSIPVTMATVQGVLSLSDVSCVTFTGSNCVGGGSGVSYRHQTVVEGAELIRQGEVISRSVIHQLIRRTSLLSVLLN